MNVIALYHFPQECGNDSLRLINCADGQVVLDINLTPDEEVWEYITRIEPLEDEIGVFYDSCTRQRYDLYDQRDDFASSCSSFADRECTKYLWSNLDWYWQVREDDNLTIVNVKDTGVLPFRSETEKKALKGRERHSWEYTVQRVKLHYDRIYHKEWDSVYKEILEKCGIECPEEERYDTVSLAERICEALHYKLLNVL